MLSFLREFRSWYWSGDFDDPEAREALAAHAVAGTPEEFRRAFLVLLRSTDVAARGTALDLYDRAGATSRFGEESPYEPYREEVLATARELLAGPPRPGDARAFEGADHASALLALKNDAGPQDAEAVRAVLLRRPDGDLLDNALGVTRSALAGPGTPDAQLVALVGELVFDTSLDVDERGMAVGALRQAGGAEATALLVRATGVDDVHLQQEAAWGLTFGSRFYAHRPLLERLDAEWPEAERRFEAGEVRSALGLGPHSTYWHGADPEGEGLRRAHRELRAPSSKRAHRQAFRTMLYSGLVPLVGIALDHFCDADGLTRFGLDREPFERPVRALARHLLRLSPSPAASSPGSGAGASHASALDVLAQVAGPEDAPVLAAALLRPDAAPLVRQRALCAAQLSLGRWDVPDERLVAALEELAFDPEAAMDDRTHAVNALADLPSPRVTEVLLRAARSGALPVQVEGALGLTGGHLIEEHRAFVHGLADSWPGGEDEPDRAWLVHLALDE
ncbi:hypothetical protein GUY60_33990 [Streptomyces sp. YC537]|uniref:Uncharacterized protein n=2 Tax=Streptomyces boluensis TaxID=1775135 RepID=A0A964V0K7_9ACTN|nr:hypothetical protein [Streptomyces boluensis]